ncbi:hypothetical protein [Sorangium sp. So ce1099]|uniref:hypothetical protein n=1 Tax=Sorangium sp. So ce1099 TaxID=3133331 RepID=UPI003F5FDA50
MAQLLPNIARELPPIVAPTAASRRGRSTRGAEQRRDARYIGLPDWERRYEALCAAELEQAHGRLRTVHRTRPARMLHVGNVVPGGWRDAEVREPVGGRPKERNDVLTMTSSWRWSRESAG